MPGNRSRWPKGVKRHQILGSHQNNACARSVKIGDEEKRDRHDQGQNQRARGFAITASADTAQEVWNAKCKTCHGEDGRAQTKTGKKEKIPDMTAPKWQGHINDQEIKHTITEGSDENPKMKPFKEKLSEQEIDSLVKHIRGLAKK